MKRNISWKWYENQEDYEENKGKEESIHIEIEWIKMEQKWTNEDKGDQDIKERITKANRTFWQVNQRFICKGDVSQNTKMYSHTEVNLKPYQWGWKSRNKQCTLE